MSIQNKSIVNTVTSYCSGASNIADLRGLIQAEMPIGLELNRFQIGSDVYNLVVEYALDGGKVMVDSGAFNAFTHGLKIDFDDVIQKYFRIAKDMSGNVLLVAPDKVGDQPGTFELLEEHMFSVRKLMGQGASVVVPVQKGSLSPYDAWQTTIDVLGSDNFGIAVPSFKAAFNDDDLYNLLSGYQKPPSIHFLGMTTANRNFARKKRFVLSFSPTTAITMDGCRIKAKLGQGRPITVKQHALKQARSKEYYDNLMDSCITSETEAAHSGVGEYSYCEDGGDLAAYLLSGDFSADELKEFIEACMYSTGEHNLDELVKICQSNGVEELEDILGDSWFAGDHAYSVLQNIIDNRLNVEIRKDNHAGITVGAQQETEQHTSEIRTQAVYQSMIEDPHPAEICEKVDYRTTRVTPVYQMPLFPDSTYSGPQTSDNIDASREKDGLEEESDFRM